MHPILMPDGSELDLASYLGAPLDCQSQIEAARLTQGCAWCGCQAPPRPLVIRRIHQRLFLALWPGDGQKHAQDCHWHRELQQTDSPVESGQLPAAPPWLEERVAKRLSSPVADRAPPPPMSLPPRPAPAETPRALNDPARRGDCFDFKARFGWAWSDRDEAIVDDDEALGLQGLMALLWSRTRLNAWWPGWTRNWARVVHTLYSEADQLTLQGQPLGERLWIADTPAQASRKETAAQRHVEFQSRLLRPQQGPAPTGLILAEPEELRAARSGHVLVLRGAQQPIFLTGAARTAMLKRFPRVLSILEKRLGWPGRIVGLFQVTQSIRGDGWQLRGAHLMLTHPLWLPVSGEHDLDLAEYLLQEGRGFVRRMHGDMPRNVPAARNTDCFVLQDTARPTALWVPNLDMGAALSQRRLEMRSAALADGHDWLECVQGTVLPARLTRPQQAEKFAV